jgi:uncharacterized protein (TIGR02145 family)
MLYSSYAFTKNNSPTITKTDGSTYQTQRDILSADDIEIIELMYATPEGGCDEFTLTYGGQTYDLVEIGNQCWMAENMNFETPNSWWYDNSSSNGDLFGRLYYWADAMVVCPQGWHLPSDEDWKILEMSLGMTREQADETSFRGTDEGNKLKSVGSTYWNSSNNGTNSSGFNALPAGQVGDYFGNPVSGGYGGFAKFWTSTQNEELNTIWYRWLFSNYDQVYRYQMDSTELIAYSVRCLKDE